MDVKQSFEVQSQTLGPYRLLVSLGVGGMGQVWAAHDTSAPGERVVAVKTTTQAGAEALRVLWDEARVASLIQHPNVCPVYELDRVGELTFLVMQWCDGASLHELLEAAPDHRLEPVLAARIVSHVAAGLHAAHQLTGDDGELLHVVHRDVSPQNILISTAGLVTVTDFGVAKAAGHAHQPTQTGELKGKLSYMAPEQVAGRGVDCRADVFALGCVLYQATLGRRPFHGSDALATMYQLLEEEVKAPGEIDPNYPEGLEAVVARALAKNRDERYQTAEELHKALEAWLVASRTLVSDSDVVDMLDSLLGNRVQERNQRIFQALRTPDRGPAAEAPAARGGGDGQDRTIAGTSDSKTSRPDIAAGKVMRGTVLAAVAAVGLGVALWIRVAGDSHTNVAPAGASVQPAGGSLASRPPAAPSRPSVSEPAMVSFSVAALPLSAEVLLDGRLVGVGSFSITVKPSTELHELVVRAPGYRPQQRAVAFDRSRALTVQLVADDPKAPTPRVVPRAAKRTQPAADRTQQQPGAVKQPRRLDTSNPFDPEP
jgi:serine/threonine-protein kinase